ncbi:unnamed protein product [Peronospora belbahrii]|uniref:Uncharacterized protein n=1 Tax=Peronospora belbahrii TaxID=622444 RepID=A0ABN8CLV8_9STRA|nr:unnamed protein product [Peronospora belbahrii]
MIKSCTSEQSLSGRGDIMKTSTACLLGYWRDPMTKKIKRTAAAAGLGKKFKPKHAARKAAKAAADAAMSGKTSKKRKHDHVDSKKVTKSKV